MDAFPTAKFCLPPLSHILTGPRLSPRLVLAILESKIALACFDPPLSFQIDFLVEKIEGEK